MVPAIASPVPRAPTANRKDFMNFQKHEEGRATPLPQYEKTQSVPFALTLQEDKNNPGQFQLVVDIDPESKKHHENTLKPTASKKLFANLQAFPSLGYDVSTLYRTQKSSPPASPQTEKQGWSDLDAIPSEFLQKVVPDWPVTFERKDSTASTQSHKLADIKARIKKSGKGFVVRLLKGSTLDSNDVAEVHLGHTAADAPGPQELDAEPCAELDADESSQSSLVHQGSSDDASHQIFEIGTSGESGVRRLDPRPSTASNVDQRNILRIPRASITHSILEEGFSDAETLIQEVRSVADVMDDEQTDLEPFSSASSKMPTRASSIVKTPTRGLSVVGPVQIIRKNDRNRRLAGADRRVLNRSDARKSVKQRSPRHSSVTFASSHDVQEPQLESQAQSRSRDSSQSSTDAEERPHAASSTSSATQHTLRQRFPGKSLLRRRNSAEELPQQSKQKAQLRLQTNVPLVKSANTSPVSKRKHSPRIHKTSSISSAQLRADKPPTPSPEWSEVDPSEEIREALEKAFGSVPDELHTSSDPVPVAMSRPEQPTDVTDVGKISIPLGEIRSAPISTRSPLLTFWELAVNALAEKALGGLLALQGAYGREPPVAPNHVRVRWTCSCGEQLYDDFLEQRPGAARLLEAYLNRPRSHTPTSPTGRSSTSSTMSSVFDSVSRASTLATPASTYGGCSWTKGSGPSRYDPTQVRSNNPFSVRIGSFLEEQWLLTCANEGRFTPKIVHIDVNEGKIKSDKDLALALREHYNHLNSKWFSWAKLRGLTTIEFVQFEVHRNRFADIRAAPSMPPSHSAVSDKAPSDHPYSFEPVDLMPPVGSTYLLHLFKHPSDYDGELVTYARSPKRRERLEYGVGWGINLVEGFLVQKVWMCLMLGFVLGSTVFAILWAVRKGDVQGAFGVAGWMVTMASLVLGGLQAWLD